MRSESLLAKNPDLFVRGALTSAQRATQFSLLLGLLRLFVEKGEKSARTRR